MSSSFYRSSEYQKLQSEIAKHNWKVGLYKSLIKLNEIRKCKNKDCPNKFSVKPYNPRVYCSQNCAAHVNNLKRPHLLTICLRCGGKTKRSYYKYCSNKCQTTYQHNQYIQRWKKGLENGEIGVNTKATSYHLKRYLLETYGNKCTECGWSRVNQFTGKVPLEIDHKNGDSHDNSENNLRLICPNCHSLSQNFRNLNKGHGRSWRIANYHKSHFFDKI